MSVVVRICQRAKGNVSAAMVLWSIAMAVVLCAWELDPSHEGRSYLWGLIATVLFGVYLGWQRRGGAVFIAPFVSWSFAWAPLWVSAMIRHGFVKGLFVGLFLITVGWLLIGAGEFLSVGAVTLLFRALRGGGPRPGDREVVIFGPDERP